MDLVTLLVGFAIGWLWSRVSRPAASPEAVVAATGQSRDEPVPTGEPVADESGAAGDAATQPEPTATASDPAAADVDPRTRAHALAQSLTRLCEDADRGSDLAPDPRFIELTALIGTPPFTADDRLQWVTSQNTPLSCAALAAMANVGDDSRDGVVRATPRMGYMALHFALLHLAEASDPGICGGLLLRARDWWTDHPASRAGLIRLLDRQQELGLLPAIPARIDDDWDLDQRLAILRSVPHPLTDAFALELRRHERLRRGQRELAQVGRALEAEAPLPVAESEFTRRGVATLLQHLEREPRRSCVLIGAGGAGKTTLAHSALRQLVREGWQVIEATPAQLMAGQKFIGEIEQRVENLVLGLGRARCIWFVPECHQLLETGAWSGNPRGLLDLLLPHLERGSLQLLGETTLAAWSRVLTQRPRVEALVTTVRVESPSDAETLELAADWGRRFAEKLGCEVLSAAIATEARQLARQQFPDRAEPGRTLGLLKEALATAISEEPARLPLDRELLLATLAKSSGLPLEILDNGRALDVDAVRSFFSDAVIGQDEAVDCLVDRIAMLKAGLTDPQRPIGVFLFAGPTGTGKTEIAKTLARFLFGSPERMLRLDMSEFQAEDSYIRLIADDAGGQSSSLTTRIRQHPFSVVLLDEFEKAHPRIWDLFLQVFDDGRLTDRAGNTADFRHSIIILTSNLGATISKGAGIGFVAQRSAFTRELVDRAIDATFRREFINRLDRVVVFNPLTRALMRDILQKELRGVLERRGFRSRDWAVEWEPSAIEFLLDKGFTPDLGARPLRRAIDQHLLAPLARTIVEHKVPDGEQFLFVHGDAHALQVRFVDPDAPTAAAAPAAAGPASDLRALALDPRVDAIALASLQHEIVAGLARIEAADWQGLKESAALCMQQADFWQRPERQSVLDRLERADRIEAGFRAAQSLHARMSRSRGRGATDLVRRLALQLIALHAAATALLRNEPEDARLEIRPADLRAPGSIAWRDRLLAMYLQWAEQRGMRATRSAPDVASGAICLQIGGGAAYQALRFESGMHVLDRRQGDSDVRSSARVSVSADPPWDDPLAPDADLTRICRRYEDGPAPLVRDNVRGWRSGRLECVLAGDFDLFGDGSDVGSA